jgi:sodium/bile acid cotransporter 7
MQLASKRRFPPGVGFALLLLLAAVIGVLFPDPFTQKKWGESGQWATVATFVIFIFIGRSISLDVLAKEMKRPMVMFAIQGSIFLATWILASLLYRYSHHLFSSPYFMGFLVVLVLPSTISSCIVYARVAGGSSEFALGHSFLSNFIAPFLFPLLCVGWLYGVGFTGVSFMSVVERIYPRLGLLILLPLILGYLSQKIPQAGLQRDWEKKAPQACILFLSYVAFASGSSLGLLDQPISQWMELLAWTIVCWLVLSFLGWISGKVLGLKTPERISAYFVVSQKSLATGIPLIFAVMGTQSVEGWIWIILPLTFYHLFQLLAGAGILAYLNREVLKDRQDFCMDE